MRTSEPAPGTSPGFGGGPAVSRGQGPSTQSLVWIIAGAAVVVCAAIVTTVFLVRPAAPTLALAKASPAPPAANTATATTATPVVASVAPIPPKSPEAASVKTEAPIPAGREAALPPPKTAVAIMAPAPVATRPVPPSTRLPPSVPVAAPAGSAQPDPRVQSFVDAIKVAGIRSSGTDSKVLMNDKVFRVNDIVDRALNLRLIEVQADNLTFVDENSVTYVKNF